MMQPETQLAMTRIEISDLQYGYDAATRTLDDVSLHLPAGKLCALLGPSGCGKTTLLKLLAGLLTPQRGTIRFNDDDITALPSERRNVAMVFQQPLLFPHLNVADNVGFGLRMRGVAANEIRTRVAAALAWVQLQGYETRKPHALSGGQEQRVALARALVTAPRVLLLDEPFSALDETLRAEMRLLVRELQQRLNVTTVFVTHDQREAFQLADHVALLLSGRLEQFGTPRDLLLAPASARVAQFCGWALLAAQFVQTHWQTPAGALPVAPSAAAGSSLLTDARYTLAIRLDGVRLQALTTFDPLHTLAPLKATVLSLLDTETRWHWRVRLPNGDSWEGTQHVGLQETAPAIGETVQLDVPFTNVRHFIA